MKDPLFGTIIAGVAVGCAAKSFLWGCATSVLMISLHFTVAEGVRSGMIKYYVEKEEIKAKIMNEKMELVKK